MPPLHRVSFHPDLVTLCVRTPKPLELDALHRFQEHTSACITCYQLRSSPSTVILFCSDGARRAFELLSRLHIQNGRVYAAPRLDITCQIVVEIPTSFVMPWRLLRAMQRPQARLPTIEAPIRIQKPAYAKIRAVSTSCEQEEYQSWTYEHTAIVRKRDFYYDRVRLVRYQSLGRYRYEERQYAQR